MSLMDIFSAGSVGEVICADGVAAGCPRILFAMCAKSEDRSVHARVVKLPVDLARFDLAQCHLFLDVVEYHQEGLALLCIS